MSFMNIMCEVDVITLHWRGCTLLKLFSFDINTVCSLQFAAPTKRGFAFCIPKLTQDAYKSNTYQKKQAQLQLFKIAIHS